MPAFKEKNNDLLSGRLIPKMLTFTLPIMVSSLLQLLFNAADLIVVGKFDTVNGSAAQAAITSTVSMINLLVGLFTGLSVGVNAIVARIIGSKNYKELTTAVQTSMLVSGMVGIFVAVIGFIISKPILGLMNIDPSVFPLSVDYLRIYFLGTPFGIIYNFGSAVMRAHGDTRRPMVYLSIAGVANIFLNLFTVIVLDMSVRGVAISTAVSNVISALLIVIHLIRTDEPIKFVLHGAKISGRWLSQIVQIGLPAGVQGSLFSLSNVVIQSSINLFGPHAMAGNGNATNLEGFIWVSMNAFSVTSITFISQCIGAGQYHRLGRIFGSVLALVTAVGAAICAVAYIFRMPLMHIYSNDAVDISYALDRLRIILPTYVLGGMMDTTVGAVRGMGHSFSPTVISLIGACVLRIVWVYTVFAHFKTLGVLYISLPVSWALTLAALLVVYFIYKHKLTQNAKPSPLSA